jgi:hypothetical protein
VPGGGFYYLAINMTDPELGQAEVREALRWCIDYEGINEALMRNYGIAWKRQIPPGIPGAIEEDLDYAFDHRALPRGAGAAGASDGFRMTAVLTLPPIRRVRDGDPGHPGPGPGRFEILPAMAERLWRCANRDFQPPGRPQRRRLRADPQTSCARLVQPGHSARRSSRASSPGGPPGTGRDQRADREGVAEIERSAGSRYITASELSR